MKEDPNEWNNLAANPKYQNIIQSHKKWVPKNNKKPVSGSKYRILTYDEENGKVIWEGKAIKENEPIPEI